MRGPCIRKGRVHTEMSMRRSGVARIGANGAGLAQVAAVIER